MKVVLAVVAATAVNGMKQSKQTRKGFEHDKYVTLQQNIGLVSMNANTVHLIEVKFRAQSSKNYELHHNIIGEKGIKAIAGENVSLDYVNRYVPQDAVVVLHGQPTWMQYMDKLDPNRTKRVDDDRTTNWVDWWNTYINGPDCCMYIEQTDNDKKMFEQLHQKFGTAIAVVSAGALFEIPATACKTKLGTKGKTWCFNKDSWDNDTCTKQLQKLRNDVRNRLKAKEKAAKRMSGGKKKKQQTRLNVKSVINRKKKELKQCKKQKITLRKTVTKLTNLIESKLNEIKKLRHNLDNSNTSLRIQEQKIKKLTQEINVLEY